MYQRRICPSVGVMKRSLPGDKTTIVKSSPRQFHCAARLQADSSNSSSAPSTPKASDSADVSSTAQRGTRRIRNVATYNKLSGIQQRSGGLAPGVIPGGQSITEALKQGVSKTTTAEPVGGRTKPLIQRVAVGATKSPTSGTPIKAPSVLRITRNVPRSPSNTIGGPNLRGRERPATDRGSEQMPKRRERKKDKSATSSGKGGAPDRDAESKIGDQFSDAMVQHLLRLQRKEWDKVPYEPKYAHGSPAALELVEAGKRLFQGNKPDTVDSEALARRIGVVGMHGV